MFALRSQAYRTLSAHVGTCSKAVATGALSKATMSSVPKEEQDVVVIGGGPGGYVAAIKGAQLGLKVTCVEGRGSLGGTCLNVGCIPSKALLNASHKYEDASKHFAELGIKVDGISMDVDKMLKQKDKVVTGLTKGIEHLFKKYGVTYVKGWGSLTKNANEVSVRMCANPNKEGPHCEWQSCSCENEKISTKNVVIAAGSDPVEIPFMKYDEDVIVSSTGALRLKSVPKKMVVVGAGIIGLELGSVWSRLGADVTVVEFADRISPVLDVEIGKSVQKSLEKQGLKFKLAHKVVSCDNHGSGKGATISIEDTKTGTVTAEDTDVVLVAVGRRPFPDKLRAQEAGVAIDKQNRVIVDQHWQTSVKGIYGIGDIVAGPMLAHKAEEEGVAVMESLAGKHGHVNYDAIPGVLYTHPEVAWVGKSEEELKAAGIEYNVGKFSFMANSRARANNDTEGLVKILAEKGTDRVLGCWIVGSQAGEQIAEAVLAMEYGASSEDIARTCHAHPTLGEAFKEAAMAAHSSPIHS